MIARAADLMLSSRVEIHVGIPSGELHGGVGHLGEAG